VVKLREELSLRNLNTKGLKQDLVARLTEALKEAEEGEEEASTQEKAEESKTASIVVAGSSSTEEKKDDVVVKGEESSAGEIKEESMLAAEDEAAPMIQLVDASSIMEQNTSPTVADEELKPKKEDPPEPEGEFPLIKEGMSAEEKKIWERRYSVPKTPKLLVYPGASGLDVTLMSLGSLRDYRPSDKKEESFEVSLFSEQFYEMLERDAAFRIYREVRKEYRRAPAEGSSGSNNNGHNKGEDGGDHKGSKEESSEEPPSKKQRKNSLNTTDILPAGEQKLKIVDPLLLMAFTFFDQSRCGYIVEGDLEEICAAVGIGITRRTVS
jgi:hypothetical protein